MENEVWKIYNRPQTQRIKLVEVSNFGNVKINGKLLDLSKLSQKRYYCAGGRHIHRMVAELFISNPNNKPEIDHIDTNKHNNRADNLRWVNRSENMRNCITYNQMLSRTPWNKGLHNVQISPMLGKHHSEETKRKISESHKQKKAA